MSTRRSRRWSSCARAIARGRRLHEHRRIRNHATQVAEIGEKYKYGFVTDIEMERAPKGLSEDTVRYHLGQEGRAGMDAGMAAGRLPALAGDERAQLGAGALSQDRLPERLLLRRAQEHAAEAVLDEVDPKLLETYKKLGIPLHEQMALAGVAVDAVFDSVSVATTFKEKLNEAGVIFCPI